MDDKTRKKWLKKIGAVDETKKRLGQTMILPIQRVNPQAVTPEDALAERKTTKEKARKSSKKKTNEEYKKELDDRAETTMRYLSQRGRG